MVVKKKLERSCQLVDVSFLWHLSDYSQIHSLVSSSDSDYADWLVRKRGLKWPFQVGNKHTRMQH